MENNKTIFKALIIFKIFVSLSLIVVGIINLKDAFPPELFYAPDGSSYGVQTYEWLVSRFIFATIFIGIPRQESYGLLVNYFNVFAIELIIYGGLFLLLSFLCIFVKKKSKTTLFLLIFVVSMLALYLLCTTFLCSSFSISFGNESLLVQFDYIYSIVVLSILALVILPALIVHFIKTYGEETEMDNKQFAKIFLFGVYQYAALLVISVYLGVYLGDTSSLNLKGENVSVFTYVLRKYTRDIGSQGLFICPSILYCAVIIFTIYLIISLIRLIVIRIKRSR